MELRRAFTISTYLLVLTGILSLSLAEGSPLLIAVSSGLCLLAYWQAEVQGRPVGRLATTLLVFVALAASPIDFSITGDAILALSHFLIAVQIVKLFGVKAPRDYVQIYLISLMHLGVSAVLTIDLTFSLAFVIYIVIATWTLSLFTLVREVEARSGPDIWRTGGPAFHIGRSFLGGAALVSIGTLALSVVFFIAFPRFSAILFNLQRPSTSPRVSGFTDEIGLNDLSNMQLIHDDVAQIQVKVAGDRLPQLPKWRGWAFDLYENGRWKRSWDRERPVATRAFEETRTNSKVWRFFRPTGEPPAPPSSVARYRVHLAPVGTKAIFAVPRVRSIEFFTANRPRNIAVDRADSLAGDIDFVAQAIYEVESIPADRERARRARVDADGVIDDIDYLAPPAAAIDIDRLAALGREAVEWAGARTPYERAQAIEAYLKRTYAYTLDLRPAPPGVDPIEDFLYTRKQGHCELFASAFVLIARTQGLPARLVDGFQSGEWNEIGHFFHVRQSDAHAWAEVHFEGVGWVDFDPTPASDEPFAEGLLARFRQFREYLRLRWLNYVISYNLSDQLSFADKIRQGMRRLQAYWWDIVRTLYRTVRVPSPESIADFYMILAAVVGVAFAGGVLYQLRGRRRRKAGRPARRAPPVPFWEECQRALDRRGWRRVPTETAREFTARVLREGGPSLEPAGTAVDAFYKVRFGARQLAPEEEATVRSAIERLRNPGAP